MEFDIRGLDEWQDIAGFMATISSEIQLLVSAKGTRAMAAVVGKRARTLAPVRTGLLKKSIGWRSKSVTVVVPVVLKGGRIVNRRRRVNANAIVYTWGSGGGRFRRGTGARYGYIAERGRTTVRPFKGRFFLRDAFDESRSEMTVAYLAKAREEVGRLRTELASVAGGHGNIRRQTEKLLVASRTRLGSFV